MPSKKTSASKAKSSVLSSGLENVLFNDFIDDELHSEDVSSEQRASASLPDSLPIESEEERAAREEDEMAALDAVGEGVVCMCSCVGVCVCHGICDRVRAVDMCSKQKNLAT